MTEQKTTTRKPRTARTKTTPNTVVEETLIKVEEVKYEIKDTDKIAVMNNTTGKYAYHGDNGYSFTLEEYGDVAHVPFEKLRHIMASKKAHVTKGYIMILNEDAVDELNQNKLYENMYTPEEVDELLEDATLLLAKYPKMPDIMKETVIYRARQKSKLGEIESMSIVKAIRELAKVDINVNTVLSDMK